jgi:pilus assembly protein CpaF
MGLRERITRRPETAGHALGGPASPLAAEVRAQDTYHELKQMIHRQLIDRLDLASLENVDNEFLQQQVDRVVRTLLKEQDLRLSPTDEERLVKEIRDETFGLGPIEPLLHDPEVSDILVNTYRQVFVERRGKLELTNVTFRDDQHLRVIIDRIVSRVGRRVDEASP